MGQNLGADHRAGFEDNVARCIYLLGCIINIGMIILRALAVYGILTAVIGAIYIGDCHIQHLIPIWLIVSGCVPMLYFLRETYHNVNVVGVIGALFNFAWLICGTVLIAPIYFTVKDGCPGSTICCNATLMDFALAMLIIYWVLFFLLVVLDFIYRIIQGVLQRLF